MPGAGLEVGAAGGGLITKVKEETVLGVPREDTARALTVSDEPTVMGPL